MRNCLQSPDVRSGFIGLVRLAPKELTHLKRTVVVVQHKSSISNSF